MITYDYFTPPSILSPKPLAKVLNLQLSYYTRFSPLEHKKPWGRRHAFMFLNDAYIQHPELRVVSNAFTKTGSGREQKLMNLLLAMTPDKETILQAQEMVEEIATNEPLYNDVLKLILTQPIFYGSSIGEQGRIETEIRISSERAKKHLDSILDFQKHGPKSKGMYALFSWAQSILDDKLYQEVAQEKELAKRTRIIAVAEPEFGDGLRYGKLKEGVTIDDVVDFYNPKVDSFTNTNLPHDHPDYGVKKQFITYKNSWTKAADETIVLSSAQDIAAVNDKSVELLTASFFAATAQLHHALTGANFYRQIRKEGLPLTFPEIVDHHGRIEMNAIYPLRMVLEGMNETQISKVYLRDHGMLKKMHSIDFTFEHPIMHMEGPNDNGKTELLRTMYLGTHFTNSGFPVPAKSYQTSLFPAAHFFKFKKTPGTGGSELERDIFFLRNELMNTYANDLIFIDEFGDATNDETSQELARRLFPILQARHNPLIITTHQAGLKEVVKSLGGEVYRPSGQEHNPYQPVVATGVTDYKPDHVLNKMGVTSERIAEELPTKRPREYSITYHAEEEMDAQYDDLPF